MHNNETYIRLAAALKLAITAMNNVPNFRTKIVDYDTSYKLLPPLVAALALYEREAERTPVYYALKDCATDYNNFAVIQKKETHEETMAAFDLALRHQFDTEINAFDIDLSDCAAKGKTVTITGHYWDDDGEKEVCEYCIEIEETSIY